jgi:DNA-binding transcriptional regulator YiaG
MSAADNIKEIRLGLCLSQEDFSNMLGVHRVTVSTWEAGTHFPRINHIRTLINLGEKIHKTYTYDDFID